MMLLQEHHKSGTGISITEIKQDLHVLAFRNEFNENDIKVTKLRIDIHVNFAGLSHAGTDTIHVYSTVGCASKYAECECVTPAMTETTRVDNTHIISMSREARNLAPM